MLTAGKSQLAISCVTQTSLCSGEQVALLRPKHYDPIVACLAQFQWKIIVATAAGGTPDDIQEEEERAL